MGVKNQNCMNWHYGSSNFVLRIVFNFTLNGFQGLKIFAQIRFHKDIDKDDYMLSPNLFAVAHVRWGLHTIDRFSSFKTRQIPRCSSRWLNPCKEYLDAFTASWSGENNWLFPPPCIIPRVLKHLQFSHVNGTLVVPLRTTAP